MSEEQMNDSTFGRLFIIMILAMTILTIILVVFASVASKGVNDKLKAQNEAESSQAMAESLAPMGSFSATTVAAAPAIAEVLPDLVGDAAYATCSACHAAGPGPIVGDASVWAERIAKGTEVLYNNAINGIGAMPPKGGVNLSDNTVRAAVDYMIEQSQ